jgi:hypothetical protein
VTLKSSQRLDAEEAASRRECRRDRRLAAVEELSLLRVDVVAH